MKCRWVWRHGLREWKQRLGMRKNEENKINKKQRGGRGVGMGEERTRKKNEGKQEANRREKVEKVEHVRGKLEKGHARSEERRVGKEC